MPQERCLSVSRRYLVDLDWLVVPGHQYSDLWTNSLWKPISHLRIKGRLTLVQSCEIFLGMQHHLRVQWWKLYVIALPALVVIALTTNGTDDKSVAWHFGTIIVIAGILAIWRLSEPPGQR